MTDREPLVRPSVSVAACVFVAYTLIVVGVQKTSGIPYDHWFDSTGNIVRAPLASLAAGAVLLTAFALWARWPGLWRDTPRLPTSRSLRAVVWFYAVIVVIRLVGGTLDGRSTGWLALVLAVGILVGYSEELLFRGVLLTGLRASGRAEGIAFLAVTVWFGALHLANALLGASLVQAAVQSVIAGLAGVALYLARRSTGLLVMAMLAHGAWDVSVIVGPPPDQPTAGSSVAAFLTAVLWLGEAAAALYLIVRESSSTPEGAAHR